MKNVIIHLTLFRFELLIKTQAKYHLPASQPSVWCCKIIVIKGPGKFMWSLQKNRVLLLPRIDLNHFSRASFNFSYVPVFTLCRPSRQILVPRTPPEDPVWPSQGRPYLTFQGRPNLTCWGSLEMTSRVSPNLTFKGRPWEVDSGRSQDVVRTSPRGPLEYSNLNVPNFVFVFNFSFRTYSIDQIYLNAFEHSRCVKNPVKLLSIFWKIS